MCWQQDLYAMILPLLVRMVSITVDLEKCIGCGKCRQVCPKGPRIWRLEGEGKTRKAHVLDEGSCLYCTLCISRCPTDAITIKV